MPISQGASRLSGEDFVPGNTASERSAIPHRYKWDLTRVFEDWQAWEREFAAVASDLPRLIKRRGSLGESAAALREAV
jgi:oligoendopeptidase F